MSQIRAFFCSPWESTTNPCNPARTHIAPLSSRVQSAGLAPGPRPRRPLPGGTGRARSAAPPRGRPPRPLQAGGRGVRKNRAFPPPQGRGYGEERRTRLMRPVFFSHQFSFCATWIHPTFSTLHPLPPSSFPCSWLISRF